ncbi:unnamed protein product [marine sediment metagenome]|uniref:Uncharacterized protein n=1 Tax=marine sediment metagenome TaxID=412755 RepID=X0TQ66_9ZZZZ
MNTRRDKITKTITPEDRGDNEAVADFLKKLSEMETVDLDFRSMVLRAMDEAEVGDRVREVIEEAIL